MTLDTSTLAAGRPGAGRAAATDWPGAGRAVASDRPGAGRLTGPERPAATQRRRGPQRPLAALAVTAICLAPLLAACAGAAAQVKLPAKPVAARAAAVTGQRPLPEREQVIAAYTGYTDAMTAAFASRSQAEVRQLLAPYLDAAAIRSAIRAFGQAWAQDEVSYGHLVQHIIGVRISGAAAWVHDCDNASQSGLENARTGDIVQGSLGTTDENMVTRLNRVDGHWVVFVQTIEDVSCTV
jgi:hypothetical protein